MSNTDTITAYKGNLTQTFTRKSWEILGSDKYGWELIPEVPKEVLSKFNQRESAEDAEKRAANAKYSPPDRVPVGGILDFASSAQDDAGDSLPEAPKEQSAGVPKQTRKSKKRR